MLGLLDTRAGYMLATSAIMLVGFFLRTWQVGAYDLWVDEGISYYVANLSPLEVIAYTMRNIYEHPPGYYFSLHYWMQMAGTSEFALRFFGGLGGTLYLALLITIARRWLDRRLAVLVGALFCVQPLAVTLSRDARMYTWYGVGVLLVVYLFDRALERRGVVNWLLFALAALFALSFEYLSAFVLMALALFAIIHVRTLGKRLIPFFVVVAVLFGLPLLWILLSPGPRGSFNAMLSALGAPWSPVRLVYLYFGWPLSGAADSGQTPQLWLLAGLRWLLVALGLIWPVASRRWSPPMFRWLLALLVIFPPLAASLPFTLIKQRYFFPTLGFFVIAEVFGILVFWRCLRAAPARARGLAPAGASAPAGALISAGLVAALLLMDGRAAFAQLRDRSRPFSVPMNYILARARDGEPVVYTFPWENYLNEYYNARKLPVVFVPEQESPTTAEQARSAATDALAKVGSAWLVIYPSLLKPEIVEQGFNEAGFAGEKSWFPGDRGVVRYFDDKPLAEQPGGMVWADRIQLNRWWTSGTQIAAGDALRLQFEWQDLAPDDEKKAKADESAGLIEVSLFGADGQTWATRVGAPCNGLCPLSGWGAGNGPSMPVTERQALYIPADVPPGRYAVHLRWLAQSGEPMLVLSPGEATRQAFVKLMDVEVQPPAGGPAVEAPLADLSGARTGDGNLTLVSVTPPAPSVLPGQPVTVPMQWQVGAPVPDLEARLILSRVGPDTVLAQPLGPAWYPSSAWAPGRLVHTQPVFTVPGTLAPGEYRVTLAVGQQGSPESLLQTPLGALTVRDREHRFDLPDVGEAVNVDWQEGIHLARADVPAEIKAGETMTVTLAWQAGRPTGGNWKVFVHLVDAAGTVRGQGDAYPLNGAALTPTWKAGEVILDPHRIEVPVDVPPGRYALRVGFYDESTNQRLPMAQGADTYVLPQSVDIKAP